MKLLLSIVFVTGVVFLFSNQIRGIIFHYYIENQTYKYTQVLPNSEPKVEEITLPSIKTVIDKHPNEFEALGRLSIPSVGIDTSILYDLTNYNLSIGSVMMFPNRVVERDNMVILSHHYHMEELLFGNLGNIKSGDTIFLDYLGYNYEYKVKNVTIVDEEDTRSLENTPSNPQLTLITCDIPSYTEKRTVVKAFLKKKDYSYLVGNNKDEANKYQNILKSQTARKQQVEKRIAINYRMLIYMLVIIVSGLVLIILVV